MSLFLEFIDKKERDAIYHLKILKSLFEKQGFKVVARIKDDDPYIFVQNSDNNGDFGGIRIYEIGDIISFRVQKDPDTQPYGKAYELDVETMFEDLLEDHKDPKKAGKALIGSLTKELKRFFEKSAKAEKELSADDAALSPSNPMTRIINRVGAGASYGSLVNLPR